MSDDTPSPDNIDWWQKGRTSTSGKIKLYSSGRIGITQRTIQDHFDPDQDAVVLGIEGNDMYIRPVSEADSLYNNGYSLQTDEDRSTAIVNAQSFLEHHEIVPEDTTTYDYEWVSSDIGIKIELN